MTRLSTQSRFGAFVVLLLLLVSQLEAAAHYCVDDHQITEVCESCVGFDRLDSGVISSQLLSTERVQSDYQPVAQAIVFIAQRRASHTQRGPPNIL